MNVVKGVLGSFSTAIKGPSHAKQDYEDILVVLYTIFKLAKTKGDLALESHAENPTESSIFNSFDTFSSDHHAVEFLCDYLRLLTLGATNPHEIENIMDAELEVHHEENHAISGAIASMADATPALGIVAAVLGVIVTMGSITEPPEVLGNLIAAALVGTFAGIFISYCLFSPIAQAVEAAHASDDAYYMCMKAGIIGHMQGYAPQVSVESARKTLPSTVRPSFAELDELLQNTKPE